MGAHLALYLLFRDICYGRKPAIVSVDSYLRQQGFANPSSKNITAIITDTLHCSGNDTYLQVAGFSLDNIGGNVMLNPCKYILFYVSFEIDSSYLTAFISIP